MKNTRASLPYRLYLLGVFLILLTGCARTLPSQFYVLSPLPVVDQDELLPEDTPYFKLAIGPVEIPEYLDRPQIVIRKSEHEIVLSDFNKWAEPLNENISRIITENLSALLNADAFVVLPWRGSRSIDYRLALEVIRFDGTLTDTVSLVARWSIFGKKGKELLLKKTSSYTEPVTSQNFEALVSAQSSAVASLSREIAGDLRKISQGSTTQ